MNTALMRFRTTPGSTTRRPYRWLAAGRSKSGSCPDRETFWQDLGPGKRIVTGEGELFGEDCLLQFRTLAALMANREEPAY